MSATVPSHPSAQASYQVRFDWGTAGAAALADADLLVWVDQLGAQSAPAHPGVETALVDDAERIGDLVLRRQEERGDRVSIAVVAAGEPGESGALRFAVEDLLAAGAIIDRLADLGIDHCSPEAAAAGAAYGGLRNATRHLISASVTSRLARLA
ncbi:2-phosphosulfolactate phosphatase [Schumannella sp. 10F1B-5-1]|uniref:2-phosphosulfolactate phosphatase n=1 Tax=Schumannella sp. 10F1B-5-1 TaxID=2590780 RepID=UPI0011324365|nr:2-phosphosulfolactate phosphatase [Schumannella sp. 10F1B-5-1]TPW71700.1 2-phosphosulfolactate phosphatase [Schumannella sp. 10F1B-5-1]